MKSVGFGILILLGIILAFTPDEFKNHKKISSQELLEQFQSGEPYIHAQELAHWLIDKDPGFQLVDLRSAEDYKKYHIPGNTHIPFSQITNKEYLELLDGERVLVLASNGNTVAAQAWLLLKQMGYGQVYILAGGVNNWVENFNNPSAPKGAYTDDELFKYQFNKAAGAVFMGNGAAITNEQTAKSEKPRPVFRKRKKSKKKDDDGC